MKKSQKRLLNWLKKNEWSFHGGWVPIAAIPFIVQRITIESMEEMGLIETESNFVKAV